MNKEKYIVSFNLAGWAWGLTKEPWEKRLRRACDCLKSVAPNAWLIGLSEVIPGKNDKYIEMLKEEMPNYIVILPEAYDNNVRAAINVLLVNKDGYHRHSLRPLGNLNNLLYNYVSLETDYGYYRVINAHMPHTCNEDRPEWYQKSRRELRIDFEHAILEETMAYKSEPDMQFIMMADINATPDSPFVQKLCGPYEPTLFNATRTEDREIPTWINPEYISNHIDYVLYGMGTLKAHVIDVYANEIIDAPITGRISDHAIIRGKIRTNITDWCA